MEALPNWSITTAMAMSFFKHHGYGHAIGHVLKYVRRHVLRQVLGNVFWTRG